MKLLYDERYYNAVLFNHSEYAYEIKSKYEEEENLQTIWMQFGEVNFDRNEHLVSTPWYNVALSIYDKRKDMYTNMDNHISTGKDLIRNFIIARKMFDALEAYVINENIKKKKDVVIFIHWEDSRRRDAYYKVLSRKGYKYGTTPTGIKVIMKKFKWKDYKDIEFK